MSGSLQLPALLQLQIAPEQKSIINITLRATLEQIRISCCKNLQLLKILQNRISYVIAQIASCHDRIPAIVEKELSFTCIGGEVQALRKKARLISEYCIQLVECDKVFSKKFQCIFTKSTLAQKFSQSQKKIENNNNMDQKRGPIDDGLSNNMDRSNFKNNGNVSHQSFEDGSQEEFSNQEQPRKNNEDQEQQNEN